MAAPVQMYVAVVPGSASAPIQAYVAVVDASGNVISGSYAQPGGRLTLTTAVPVLTASVTGATAVLYTPYQTDEVPIYNGTSWLMTQFTELTNTLNDATTNPAAVVANANYDLYVWNNAGTMTLSRGPLWSKTATVTTPVATPGVVNWTNHGLLAGTPVSFSGGTLPTGIVAGTTYYVISAGLAASAFEIATAPGGAAINFTGTSSGTQTGVAGNDTARTNATDLVMKNGLLLNNLAITNGPAASRGTYVGTIRTNATSTVDYVAAVTTSGGPAGLINVWNCYNRVNVPLVLRDSAASWTYSSNVIRAANGSAAGNRVSMIRGLNEDACYITWTARVQTPAVAASFYSLSLALDSTTSQGNTIVSVQPGVAAVQWQTPSVHMTSLPGIGYHFYQATEQGDNTNTFTVGGNALTTISGLLRA